jgi:MOSC domain-containing protein YiiM
MDEPQIVSIQVGMPAEMPAGPREAGDGRQKAWVSGIYKKPVKGVIWLGQLNLAGDGQADLRVHGGPAKAVMAYSAEHYPFWRERLPGIDFQYGAFGENFTVSGMTEDSVCVGDMYRVGDAAIQVTQPRQPCWKLARRIGTQEIGPLVIGTGYSGWYFGVLHEGSLQAGDRLILLDRPSPEWTIRRVNDELINV